MAASESTKIQVNYKLNDGTMVNVYAANQAELEAELTTVQDLAALIQSTAAILAGVGKLVEVAKPLEEPVWAAKPVAAVATASVTSPTCKHGAMTYKEGISQKTGKPWKAWMCPSPKGTPDQCPADFIR